MAISIQIAKFKLHQCTNEEQLNFNARQIYPLAIRYYIAMILIRCTIIHFSEKVLSGRSDKESSKYWYSNMKLAG